MDASGWINFSEAFPDLYIRTRSFYSDRSIDNTFGVDLLALKISEDGQRIAQMNRRPVKSGFYLSCATLVYLGLENVLQISSVIFLASVVRILRRRKRERGGGSQAHAFMARFMHAAEAWLVWYTYS